MLTAGGEWKTPILLGFIDDHSRLGCHLQWYLAETAEVFVHGICQAFMKRGLPRSLLTDNGAPMMAGEVQEGLHRLGIVHATTMVYAPHMNGKCEVWWAAVEGRLMAMLEGVEPLTLDKLNDATVACWSATTTAACTASSPPRRSSAWSKATTRRGPAPTGRSQGGLPRPPSSAGSGPPMPPCRSRASATRSRPRGGTCASCICASRAGMNLNDRIFVLKKGGRD